MHSSLTYAGKLLEIYGLYIVYCLESGVNMLTYLLDIQEHQHHPWDQMMWAICLSLP